MKMRLEEPGRRAPAESSAQFRFPRSPEAWDREAAEDRRPALRPVTAARELRWAVPEGEVAVALAETPSAPAPDWEALEEVVAVGPATRPPLRWAPWGAPAAAWARSSPWRSVEVLASRWTCRWGEPATLSVLRIALPSAYPSSLLCPAWAGGLPSSRRNSPAASAAQASPRPAAQAAWTHSPREAAEPEGRSEGKAEPADRPLAREAPVVSAAETKGEAAAEPDPFRAGAAEPAACQGAEEDQAAQNRGAAAQNQAEAAERNRAAEEEARRTKAAPAADPTADRGAEAEDRLAQAAVEVPQDQAAEAGQSRAVAGRGPVGGRRIPATAPQCRSADKPPAARRHSRQLRKDRYILDKKTARRILLPRIMARRKGAA